jgi:hypothetical protein
MLIKNIFVYVSINKIGILIDWSDNKAIHVKFLIIRCVLTSVVCFHRNYRSKIRFSVFYSIHFFLIIKIKYEYNLKAKMSITLNCDLFVL